MLIYVKYYKNNQFRLTFLLSLPFSLSNSLILFWYSSFNSSSALSYFYSISMAFILVYFSFITASFNFSSSCLTFHWFSSLNVLDLESAVLLSRIFSYSKHSFSFYRMDIFDLCWVLSFKAYLAFSLSLSTCLDRSLFYDYKFRIIYYLCSTSSLMILYFWDNILERDSFLSYNYFNLLTISFPEVFLILLICLLFSYLNIEFSFLNLSIWCFNEHSFWW